MLTQQIYNLPIYVVLLYMIDLNHLRQCQETMFTVIFQAEKGIQKEEIPVSI